MTLTLKEPSHHDVLASARLAFSYLEGTSENVHGRFSIVGHALGALHGRWRTYSKKFERRKIFKHTQNFFLGPTFATLWNVCKTLCSRYEIVQVVRLSFRMRLTIVRKRWHSFAFYKGWADQLCASGVGTPNILDRDNIGSSAHFVK